MESFVHLRKGTTPRRLHADLDGLKDDELGRGGFTGRTANIYRRNDPTAYRVVGPLRPIDVLSSELKPSDATDAGGGAAADVLQRRLPGLCCPGAPSRCRSSSATSTATCCASCTRAPACWRPSSARCATARATGCTSRRRARGARCPTRETTLLMIEATDEFRVPPPGSLGRHFPFDPSQAVIPEPAPIDDDDGRDEYEVRLIHSTGRPDNALLPTQSARRRGLARRQLRVHLQHRRLQRHHLRQRAPAADGAPVHAGHRRLRDELPAQARRRRARAPNAHPGITATSTTTRSRSSTAARSTASRCRRA